MASAPYLGAHVLSPVSSCSFATGSSSESSTCHVSTISAPGHWGRPGKGKGAVFREWWPRARACGQGQRVCGCAVRPHFIHTHLCMSGSLDRRDASQRPPVPAGRATSWPPPWSFSPCIPSIVSAVEFRAGA